MSWIFLAAGAWFALLAIISHRPLYRPGALALLTWIPGWLVSELPLHGIVAQIAIAITLSLSGGLDAPAGIAGLVLTTLSISLLWHHVSLSTVTSLIVERSMRQGLGADYHDRLSDEVDPTIPWSELVRVVPKRPEGVAVERDVVYFEDENTRLCLDIYRRHDAAASAPVFLYVHGGGWVIGSKNKQGLPTVHRLARRGWVVYTIDYRLSPAATFPEHLVDVKRAIAFARKTATDHGGDPNFIVVGGGSAGAHLASLAALTPNQPRYQPGFADANTKVQGCVCYYGIYDIVHPASDAPQRGLDYLLEKFVIKKRRDEDPDIYVDASPASLVKADAPPFLLIHGTTDNLAPVAGARTMRDALARAGVAKVVYIELRGAHHAFEIFPSLRSAAIINGVDRFCHAIFEDHKVTRRGHVGGDLAMRRVSTPVRR